MLRSLKMYGMTQSATDLIEQGAPAFDASVPIPAQLLKAEVAEREVRSIAYRMKVARFPAHKDLAGFDFAASEVNEATVRQLHRCEFIDGGLERAADLEGVAGAEVRRIGNPHVERDGIGDEAALAEGGE